MAVLCHLADPKAYKAFDWDGVQDDEDRRYWLGLFESFSINIKQRLIEDDLAGDGFAERWPLFEAEYAEGMRQIRAESERTGLQSTIDLCDFRQRMLNKYGWPDPYLGVKTRENNIAVMMYPRTIRNVDETPLPQRWELLFRMLFAGNMFDLGAPDTIDLYNSGKLDFGRMLAEIRPRPWFIDHADAVRDRIMSPRRWRQALFFVDNAGTDIVLGVVPLVRELARAGTRVVLAANSLPALNDITIHELNPLLDRLSQQDPVLADLRRSEMIATVANGSNSPLIDLGRISDVCNAAAADSDLLVLQGMGRGVESNWRQRFLCDVWRVALLKDRTVAKWIGAKLFDPVCRFDSGEGSGHD
ncbi:MAG: ARMT1-like domain-containing protein [Phycisphaerae bacterium]